MSHPVRLALLEALAVRGPLTATQAGGFIDESPTTCSFHLRQLAKYGFVEEAGGGRGRNRPWRLLQLGFVIDPGPDDVAGQLASQALASIVLARQVARHERSVLAQDSYPEPWRDASWQQETVWWLTREELREIDAQIEELIHRYVDRLADRADRPEGAMPVEFVTFAHVFDDLLDPEAAGSKSGASRASAANALAAPGRSDGGSDGAAPARGRDPSTGSETDPATEADS